MTERTTKWLSRVGSLVRGVMLARAGLVSTRAGGVGRARAGVRGLHPA
jgi:hypothetical protein